MSEIWERVAEQWASNRSEFILWVGMMVSVGCIVVFSLFNAAPILFPVVLFLALRSWLRRKRFPTFLAGSSVFLLAIMFTDVYVVPHEEVEVGVRGNPNTPRAFARLVLNSTRFYQEQLSLVSNQIVQVERKPIASITDEVQKQLAPNIAQIQSQLASDRELQKLLIESELRKTQLLRQAEAHERYAEQLRQVDQIGRERAAAAQEKAEMLSRFYATKQSLASKLAEL